MRYFKYININKTGQNAFKEHYKALSADMKRIAIKEKAWTIFSFLSFIAIFSLCFCFSIFLITLIPEHDWWHYKVFYVLAVIICGIIAFVFSIFMAFLLSKPLFEKASTFYLPAMKKDIYSKACSHLRDHYKLEGPYIVTKCFDATDQKFKNHDVCIFIYKDELRITADIMRGFLNGERDLGCYAMKRSEITLSKLQKDGRLIAELKADDSVFLLGYRAKGFIENNFIKQ